MYQFYGVSWGECDKELEKTRKIISSDYFGYTYTRLMDELLKVNNADSFRIFANRYSAFFHDALSDDCSDSNRNSQWPYGES